MVKSFNEKITELLKKDLRFVDEDTGELIRSEIVTDALKIDKKLIELLIDDAEVKKKFFSEIKGHWVFNINEFIDYIQDKNFLSNSYTKFRNRIGLNIGRKFLNQRKEVSLVWPFKDCVLEGGMTKEDQKRNEIFFNEILAQDEIDRLLDPKILTNSKRVTAKGEETVSDIKRDEKGVIKENLIIKGNNLLALHSLKKEFQNQVKLIYIDPPFNTGGDSFLYNDTFNHSAWLTFMKNRLEAAKKLLCDDGAIFVQIDYHEVGYLMVLMDEIYGRENFRNLIVWKKSQGARGVSSGLRNFIRLHDNILFYSKSSNNKYHNQIVPYSENTLKMYKYEDDKGRYRLNILRNYSKDTIAKLEKEGKIHSDTNGGKQLKQYLDDKSGVSMTDIWVDISVLGKTGKESRGFGTQKPEKLLQRIISASTDEGDIVLDYHMGSGTTCAVAHKMNRQFIGIEQMHYDENGAVPRLKEVIGKSKSKGKLKETIEEFDQSGISSDINWKGGGDFVYCELLEYNETAIDKIRYAKDTKVLLKVWSEMCESYFLNYDVNVKAFNDNKGEFEKLELSKQKEVLVEMLNKNQLYVNLSEINDVQFKVSKENKEFNKKFYGLK